MHINYIGILYAVWLLGWNPTWARCWMGHPHRVKTLSCESPDQNGYFSVPHLITGGDLFGKSVTCQPKKMTDWPKLSNWPCWSPGSHGHPPGFPRGFLARAASGTHFSSSRTTRAFFFREGPSNHGLPWMIWVHDHRDFGMPWNQKWPMFGALALAWKSHVNAAQKQAFLCMN